VRLPPGTYLQFAGSAAEQARAQRNLLLVLANLPFALIGGVLAVFGSGGLLTLGSMVGFVTVFGITVRNSILMISHYEHLVAVEGVSWGPAAAIRGAADRLTPILMPTLALRFGRFEAEPDERGERRPADALEE